MCGISLIIRKNKDANHPEDAIRRMAEAQAHRGPDGSGFHYLNWESEEIWLGHNLLSLSADPELSQQPMLSEDGTCGIVYNGELYNASDLKWKLQQEGVNFRGNSDTEVLLNWLKKQGRDGLKDLEGMYAFAFWDSRNKVLIIHRDAYGIKPLYYSRNRNYLLFASEPAGLFAAGIMDYPPERNSLPYYLNYKFIPAPHTAWQGIQQLLPGECMEYGQSGELRFMISGLTQTIPTGLRSAMDEAFSSVIPKNRPFGIALSGGIDSGLILSWCLKSGYRPEIFSIRFPKGSSTHPDTSAVEEMASRFGLKVHWAECGTDIFREITSCEKPWEVPVADSAFVLTRKLAAEANKMGIRILLSGAGADEYFGGYRRHAFFRKWNPVLQLFPEEIWKGLFKVFRPGKIAWMNPAPKDAEGLWHTAVSGKLNSSLADLKFLDIPETKNSLLENMLQWDRRYYLPNDVLCISDLAGMAEGIEMRFPFLHPAMTSFADAMEAEQLMGSGRKEILRDEFRKDFGQALADRKKQGFGIPGDSLFNSETDRNQLQNWLDQMEKDAKVSFDQDAWQKFRKEALAKPLKFLPEWIAIGRYCNWLIQNQKLNS